MSLKVLVVDDASFVRDTVKRTLRQFLPNLELHEAVDGRRAMSVMKLNKIDIVLSDWEMPEMSGAELLQWVRNESKSPEVPFIMISSRGDRDHIVKAIQSGVSDYLAKPFTAEELQRKVVKQLNKIGYKESKRPAQRDSAFGSIDVLTGGNTEKRTVDSAPAGQQKGQNIFAKPAKVVSAKTGGFEGRAQLRFANLTCQCVVRELSLQMMTGFMVRPEQLPGLFDQAVVDLENKSGEALARLNAYVHSLQAMENNPDTQKIKIVVRFVDNDPEKFEIISKAIA
ncbi:Response regulator containing a CheY-like receiver domain and a GGDEF domain [Alteromonadaceae bacterium Bs31]|nr:Response regulator containing a CheY-like receiver domain and a GGDEF domain [Alteromonadaceae bacterium Bs31]